MKTFIRAVALIGLALASAVVSTQRNTTRATDESKDVGGMVVGRITFGQEDAGVHLRGTLRNLSPDAHGIHMHAVGRCTPDFKAAGRPFNPGNDQQRLGYPVGAHAGDLPNLVLGAQAPMVMLEAGAIVIHAKPDDYTIDLAGNSVDRIGCGVITAPTAVPASDPSALSDTEHTATVLSLLVLAAAGAGAGIGAVIARRASPPR